MAEQHLNPKEQGFRLYHTGHPSNRMKPDEKQLKSTDEDVKTFCDSFYHKCGCTGSDLVTSSHFYNKTGFILYDSLPCQYDILVDFLCDTGLLFSQDFGTDVDTGKEDNDNTDNGSQGMSFSAFSLNRKYFRSRPDKEYSAFIAAQHEIEKSYFSDPDKKFLSTRFFDSINKSSTGMTPEKMKSVKISEIYLKDLDNQDLDNQDLDNQDIAWLQNVVLPAFIQNWNWFLWMKECNKHYHRSISIWHRAKLDDIKIRKERMQQACDKAVEWLSLEPKNLIYINNPSYQDLECIIYNVGLQRLQIDNNKVEKFINKVISKALRNKKNTLTTLCDLIFSDLKIRRPKKPDALIVKMLIMSNLLNIFDRKNKINTARDAWHHWGFDTNFPQRSLFNAIKESDAELLIKYFPPIQLGLVINELLKETFMDKPECLTHFNPYLSRVDMVNRFKNLYPDKYQNFVRKVSKSTTLNRYQSIWCSPEYEKDDVLEYLERRQRYMSLYIPEDKQLWSGIPYSKSRIEKFSRYLKIMLSENAMQDCLRARASEKLWHMLIDIIVKSL